jgi:hypothetical protein
LGRCDRSYLLFDFQWDRKRGGLAVTEQMRIRYCRLASFGSESLTKDLTLGFAITTWSDSMTLICLSE